MDKLILKNCQIVNADNEISADILIENGKIASVGNFPFEKGVEIIDAKGLTVFPGAVDAHVHLDLPTPAGNSCDNFFSGGAAALSGGTTSVIDFVTPAKGESLLPALINRKREAVNSPVDYSFHMSITWWGSETEKEIQQCINNEGVTSFKTYLAYKGVIGIDDRELVEAMVSVKKLNGLLTVHCENGDVIKKLQQQFVSEGKFTPEYHALSRPDEAEAEAIYRVVSLAKITGCAVYIVHVSTLKGMTIINKARKEGVRVFAETCPHYLLLNSSQYSLEAHRAISYVLSPPLRSKSNIAGLWRNLKEGHIDVLATDHCPFHNKGQKDLGISDFTKIPNGGNGIEERLKLMYTYGVLKNKITMQQFVNINCAKPAKIFGLYPRKGVIAAGADADMVIWDSNIESVITAKSHIQKCDTNIYEGTIVKGAPLFVIKSGRVVLKNGRLAENLPKGQFLYRNCLK